MLTIAVCALTLKLIAASNNGPEGTAAMIADQYRREGITLTSDGGQVISDPVLYFRHRTLAQQAEESKLAALRLAGIEPDAALVDAIREQAECEADRRVAP
jgi:hypothetical protein